MEIDAYSMCPCHSGSKIKFCCGKDVIHDLEEILTQTSSGQNTAAIDHLNRTIAKSGPKECLLVIKTHLLLKSQRFEEAEEANKTLLGAAPKHFMGLQQRAMIEVATGEVNDAVNTLQDAMDQIKGEDIPINVGKTFVLIGRLLCMSGRVIAGLPHLYFAHGILEGEEADEVKDFISRLMGRSVPLVKQNLLPGQAPEGVEWAKLYSNVTRAIMRGQFRKALQFLMKIDAEYPEHEIVVGGLAVMESHLNRETAIQSWTRYAELESLTLGQKVDAMSIIAILDPFWDTGSEFGRLTVEVSDFDKVSELLIASKQTTSPFDLEKLDLSRFERRPRHAMALLNRPFDEDKFDPNESLAYWISPAYLYGKQTDKPAELELNIGVRHRDLAEKALKDMLGESIKGEFKFDLIGEESDERSLLARRLQIPRGLSEMEAHEAVKRDLRRRFVGEWVKLPLGRDDLTIEEAIKKPEYLVFVYARLFVTLTESLVFSRKEVLEIAAELGLPPIPPVDPTSWRVLESPVLLQLADPQSLSYQDLIVGMDQATYLSFDLVTNEFAREILKRDDRNTEADFDVTAIIAQSTRDPGEAIKLFEEAIGLADGDSYKVSICYLEVLRVQFNSQDFEGAQDTLAALRPYMDDPNTRYLLTALLAEYGLISPNTPIDSVIPKTAETESGILVPGQAAEASAESKLWIPE